MHFPWLVKQLRKATTTVANTKPEAEAEANPPYKNKPEQAAPATATATTAIMPQRDSPLVGGEGGSVPLPGDAAALFIAVDREHCHPRDLAALLRTASASDTTAHVWPGVPSVFGGTSAVAAAANVEAATTAPAATTATATTAAMITAGASAGNAGASATAAATSAASNDTVFDSSSSSSAAAASLLPPPPLAMPLAPILGAIVDKDVCSRASWFVGWPGSTFTNSVTFARLFVHGKPPASNFFYNQAGVQHRDDDGRRVSIRHGTPPHKSKEEVSFKAPLSRKGDGQDPRSTTRD